MNESLLDKYVKPKHEPESARQTEGTEITDDLGAFGWLRGVRERAVMLELRLRDGSVVALGYAWLHRAEFDPSAGITLHFGEKKVTIVGRSLNAERRPNVRLFAGIVRHRVPWIQEADEPELMEAAKRATVIESIQIE
jgi:hypothetical protein